MLLLLLEWRYRPKGRGSSWESSIRIQRRQVERHLRDNPSLKAKLPEVLADAYQDAVIAAAEETRLAESIFPSECPWPFESISAPDFWPDEDR